MKKTLRKLNKNIKKTIYLTKNGNLMIENVIHIKSRIIINVDMNVRIQ